MNLLQDLNAGRTAYQLYTIEHGIERIHVRIPIRQARVFESEFQSVIQTGSKERILEVVAQHSGSIRDGK